MKPDVELSKAPRKPSLKSALYVGTLRHRRFAPTTHTFTYRLYMTWLDLSELDRVFRSRWFWSTERPTLSWLRREDYLGDAQLGLDVAVREVVEAKLGRPVRGPIRLLTHLRTFGHCFNPVSFYYCYTSEERLEAIVAEITNTPWNERHTYVMAAAAGEPTPAGIRFRFDKRFHVSPFMPMDIDYDWRFRVPDDRLSVHMINRRGADTVFDATLDLERREIDGTSLAAALVAFPWITAKVVGGIYWNALRLWLKRTPLYPHPSTPR